LKTPDATSTISPPLTKIARAEAEIEVRRAMRAVAFEPLAELGAAHELGAERDRRWGQRILVAWPEPRPHHHSVRHHGDQQAPMRPSTSGIAWRG